MYKTLLSFFLIVIMAFALIGCTGLQECRCEIVLMPPGEKSEYVIPFTQTRESNFGGADAPFPDYAYLDGDYMFHDWLGRPISAQESSILPCL